MLTQHEMLKTQPKSSPQEGQATLFKRRQPEQSRLPQNASLQGVYDHIRMLDAPTYPLAFIEHGDFRLEFSRAELGETGVRAQVVFPKVPSV